MQVDPWVERMIVGRAKRVARFEARVEMFTAKVLTSANLKVKARVMMAGQLIRDKVVINISQPVRKYKKVVYVWDNAQQKKVRRVRTVVDPSSRSKPGEFPRADTTRLMKDIFYRYVDAETAAYIGTTLNYGLILETKMNRSFLRRTMLELRDQIILILSGGPAAGGSAVQFIV